MTAGRKNTDTKKDWNTPPKILRVVHSFWEHGIDLDPCSNTTSVVGAKTSFSLPDTNGMEEDWSGFQTIFVNPPYGRSGEYTIFDWINKGLEAHQVGRSSLIYLIPVATNTKHFKQIIFPHFQAICFLSDSRLKFWRDGQEDKKGAPMACCLCYLGDAKIEFASHFKTLGAVVYL